MSMKIKIEDFDEFEHLVGFWAGAKDRWDSYSEEQKEYLNDIVRYDEVDFGSLYGINDFIWFDADDILGEEFELDEDGDVEEPWNK